MQTSIEVLKEKIMDKENADEFIIDIKKKMKERFEKIKTQNEKESSVKINLKKLILFINVSSFLHRKFAFYLSKKNGNR